MTYGYDSHVTKFLEANNKDNISKHAENFLYDLQQVRKTDENRPLLFVAHSLGGIIIKGALEESKRSEHQPKFLSIYNSTRGILFLGTPHGGRISGLQGKIVDDRASIVGHARAETVAGIDADHRGIARFENRDDQGYQVVWGALQDYIGAVLKSIKTAETMISDALEMEARESAQSLRLPKRFERRDRVAEPCRLTCEWIWQHEAFQAWQSASRSSFLFISGRPGCGKSVLAKYLYSQMLVEASKSQCVASYLFDGQEDEIGRSMEGLIRSLLSEVIEKKLTLINRIPISQEYKMLKDTQQTSLVEWPLTALKNLFRSLGDAEDTEFLFIVDALDEAKPEDIFDISQLLEGLLSVDNKATFKIILTARPATFV
ncbi:hypothetical protein PMG11_05812 [Penicillium brasilianum]|uniref:NACHT domain-containing protein n=1 Tax=Penicillium brasilianum TaxID=104259 RepID=A0A0F7TNW1_PENBI|nr:hypothetical protein PMG11_05812 [Penicillium brasilianum]